VFLSFGHALHAEMLLAHSFVRAAAHSPFFFTIGFCYPCSSACAYDDRAELDNDTADDAAASIEGDRRERWLLLGENLSIKHRLIRNVRPCQFFAYYYCFLLFRKNARFIERCT
jgi:hypothetical protein